MERKPDGSGFRLTPAGKACLALALDLKLDCNVPAMLAEFVETSFVPLLAVGATSVADDAEGEDEPYDPA